MNPIINLKRFAFVIALSATPFFIYAQNAPKPNWQNLDLKTDTAFGISTEKAYSELLKGKTAKTVIVAVIDDGVDIDHEDLKNIIWVNPKESANGKDNDHNGYVGDIHGWSFLGSAKGNVGFENMEVTRIVRKLGPKFRNTISDAGLSGKDLADYNLYKAAAAERDKLMETAQGNLKGTLAFKDALEEIEKSKPADQTLVDYLKTYQPTTDVQIRVKTVLGRVLKTDADLVAFKKRSIDGSIKTNKEMIDYYLNLDFAPRAIVGDNEDDDSQRFYGTTDVKGGSTVGHGSHVSGIIAAIRDNNLGIKGVADHVAIMAVVAVPNGDERDKDVANAIRYAADNGAKVINMSFGKPIGTDKKLVDEAVKYAMSKDVLIVHAAGNDNKNLELPINTNVPNRIYEDKSGTAANWIEVGASGFKDDETLKASFSNYGKTMVDVFAPGVRINSTTPKSTYSVFDGTSMASPVVAGLAALIRSYYPKLTAAQVKDVILKSVVKINHDVIVMDGRNKNNVPFADLCVTGGVVNAYNALQMAASIN